MTELLIIIYLCGFIWSCEIAIYWFRLGWNHDGRGRVLLRVLAWPYWMFVAIWKLK